MADIDSTAVLDYVAPPPNPVVVKPQPGIFAAMRTVIDRGIPRTGPHVNRSIPLRFVFKHEANDSKVTLKQRRSGRPFRRKSERIASRYEVGPPFNLVDAIPGEFVDRLILKRRAPRGGVPHAAPADRDVGVVSPGSEPYYRRIFTRFHAAGCYRAALTGRGPFARSS